MNSVTGTSFKRPTIIYTLLLIAALMTTTADAEEDTKLLTISDSIANRANVRVDTNEGNVTVTLGENQQVEFRIAYRGYVLNKSLSIDSNQRGDEIELTVRTQVGLLSVPLERVRGLDIEIRMPRDADLQVKTGDGSIKASGVRGIIDLYSSDGAISASSLKGIVRLHTSDGAIEASDLDGKCDTSSSGGRIRISGRFDVLNTKTSNGNVSVEVLRGSKLESSWSITSGDGSIEVALPTELPASIEASTSDGHISSDIPITMEGVMSKTKVQGKMNGGGQTLTIHSSDGSIRLKQA
jgi:DUF4097 and DUF4098 domain-containing protein YvlB